MAMKLKLILVGVGYRAQLQGKKLVLAVGYAHQIEYAIPSGITIEIPSQTEVVIKEVTTIVGLDKLLRTLGVIERLNHIKEKASGMLMKKLH